ncbi:HAD family hydrolase [Jannaschia sp. M317]|uniref:HAD family hydrolase n=1 Tax=Jannaschia sp. M317 TaxID=2867011 RepID=UPI0021A6BA4B|nr:HAD family hydrolase [Jannaschia sp. M317]UWQ17083.1 HAD family hydrolase [Jannaschia sp. M317]
MRPGAIRAILFDKDGTLTDFRRTWQGAIPKALADLSDASGVPVGALAQALGFDLLRGRFLGTSLFVTGTDGQMTAAFARLTGWPQARVRSHWAQALSGVEQIPAAPLAPLLAGLRARGLKLGVLTNAQSAEAHASLTKMGAMPHLDRVIGCDSGFAPKPDPAGAAAFADDLGLARAEVVMVGDGMTDLLAARNAGLRAVAVTTGTLDAAALRPHAEVVLTSVAALPDWLSQQELVAT